MKNFKIGSEIRNVILSSSAVKNAVDTKVFPLIANAGTTFPFIVYRRNSYSPLSNKDVLNESVYMEIAIICNNYEQSVSIANDVADVLLAYESDTIEEIKVTNISEEFISDSFVQKVNLQIDLK